MNVINMSQSQNIYRTAIGVRSDTKERFDELKAETAQIGDPTADEYINYLLDQVDE